MPQFSLSILPSLRTLRLPTIDAIIAGSFLSLASSVSLTVDSPLTNASVSCISTNMTTFRWCLACANVYSVVCNCFAPAVTVTTTVAPPYTAYPSFTTLAVSGAGGEGTPCFVQAPGGYTACAVGFECVADMTLNPPPTCAAPGVNNSCVLGFRGFCRQTSEWGVWV